MSDILGTIFGSKSKEKSSSTSTSNSVTGNNAFDTINSALSPTLGFSGAGGSMIGALLGLPGYSAQSPQQAYNSTVAQSQTPSASYSGVPQTYTPPAAAPASNSMLGNADDGYYTMGGGVDGTSPIFHQGIKRDLGRTDLALPSSAGDNPSRYSYLPAVNTDTVDPFASQPGSNVAPTSTPYTPPAPYVAPTPVATPAPTGSGDPSYDALSAFANSGGMQFLMDQGRKAVEGSQAGKGMLESGATGKALEQYGQNLGSTYLNNYLTQLQDFSKLGTANAAVLSDAGKYSNALVNSNSTGSGTGGKTGLLQAFLGGSGAGPATAAAFA
jgi:hypothetical protein